MKNRAIVHVGLPKTATTFLQNKVFPHAQFKEYLTSNKGNLRQFDWVYECNLPFLPLRMDRKKKRTRFKSKFQKILDTVTHANFEGSLILSSEGFAGASYDPLLNSDLSAKILAQQLPNAKILIVLRRQAEYCVSIWRQLVFKENRFREWIDFNKLYGLEGSCAIVPVKYLRWDRLVQIYHENFGRDNVLVLPYEQMHLDPQGYISKLSEFLTLPSSVDIPWEKKENTFNTEAKYSYPSIISTARMILGGLRDRGSGRIVFEVNGLLNKIYHNIKVKKPYALPKQERLNQFMVEVAPFNKRLSDLLGQDFGRYGYH